MMPLLFSDPTSNSSANTVVPIYEMYSKSSHFSQSLQLPLCSHPLPLYSSPYLFPAFLHILSTQGDTALRWHCKKSSSRFPVLKISQSTPTTLPLFHPPLATLALLLLFKTSACFYLRTLALAVPSALNLLLSDDPQMTPLSEVIHDHLILNCPPPSLPISTPCFSYIHTFITISFIYLLRSSSVCPTRM